MANLQALLSKIDDLAEQVDAVRPLDHLTEQKIRQKLWLDWNYHSNAIEGNTLTLGETRAFLLHGITAQGKPFRDYLDIDGHRKAIEYLEEFIRHDEELTEAYIRELHRVLLVEPYEADAMTSDGRPTKRRVEVGQYKTVPNSVVTSTGAMHFYASPEETPARMGDLMAWYRDVTSKGEIHPVVLAASFHFRFVEIHPFDDGNGRMSRLLMNLMLMRNGLVPIIIPTEQKSGYILALEQADTGEIEPFIEFVGEQVVESLELYLKAARGESIVDLSDIDRNIAILEQRLSSQPVASEVQDHIQIQRLAFTGIVKPLFSQLDSQLEKLEQLFQRAQSSMSYTSASGAISLQKPLEKGFQKLEQPVAENVIKSFRLSYWFESLKNNPAINLRIHTDISLDSADIEVSSSIPPNTLLHHTKFSADSTPEQSELDEFVVIVILRILEYIEQNSNNPNV